jgi:hypothetical protein
MIKFLCCGRMGDFFHQMYSIKRICEVRGEKAHLVIGGDEISPASDFSKPLDQAVRDLKSLLDAQEYIGKVEYYSGQNLEEFDYYPSRYRNSPLLFKSCWTNIHNDLFGLEENYDYGSWINVEPDYGLGRKVLINRSKKTNSHGYPDRCTNIIDWNYLIENNECIFIAFDPDQYRVFLDEISPSLIQKLEFALYDSVLDFCRAISGCKFFIGNQSAPLAIAQALNVPRLGELSNGDSVHYVGEEKFFPLMNWVSDVDPNWHLGKSIDKIKIKFNN